MSATELTVSEPVVEEMLYARGFVLSRGRKSATPRHWLEHELHGWTLAHDPRVVRYEATHQGATVTVLGLLIDTDAWDASERAVTRAATALAASEAAFLDIVDAWAGRHLVIWNKGARTSVLTDASGMRSCFYTLAGEPILSSHASLIGRIAEIMKIRPEFCTDPRWRMYLPGRITPWSTVVFLTANTALDLDTWTLRRVWPRGSLPTQTVAAAAERTAALLSGQMRWLSAQDRPLLVSLTAGIDSRATLAACRNVAQQLAFFTYLVPGRRADERDIDTARRLARIAGVSHRELVLPKDLGPAGKTSLRVMEENSFLSHFRNGAEMYRRSFSSDTLHVRSNVAEIGRRFYDRAGIGATITNPVDMATKWKRMADVPACVSAFEDWADAVGFWDVTEVDPLDLFYWEHRMSCWHSCVLLETDLAFDTHSLFNCRRVIEAMLSAPTTARQEDQVFTSLIANRWPEIAPLPFG